MAKDKFVYEIYIRTTPKKLWDTYTNEKMARSYFFGMLQQSTWKVGAPWRIAGEDGTLMDSGKIIAVKPNKRVVIRWRHEWNRKMHAEGFSKATLEIKPADKNVKFKVTHEINRANSQLIKAVSDGWPQVFSSLKSLLETGRSLTE